MCWWISDLDFSCSTSLLVAMPDASRIRSKVYFVFFEGGTSGLVDGIAALNGTTRQKSNFKPAEKTVLEVLDTDGQILQKEAAKLEYLEDREIQKQTVEVYVNRRLTAVNYKHDYEILTPAMLNIRAKLPRECHAAGSTDGQSIGKCTGENAPCPFGPMATAIRNLVNPSSDLPPVPYTLGARIAAGSFGYVYEAVQSGDQVVAVKMTRGAYRSQRALQQTLHEVLVHEYIGNSSAYICGLIDVYFDPTKRSGVNSSGFHLVFPRMTNDLRGYLGSKAATARSARWVAYSLLEAISHVHAKGIIHADISFKNVLVLAKSPNDALHLCQVQLADFGAAVLMNDRRACPGKDEGVYKQTLPYRAPEVALGDHQFTKVVDEWSVGVILYEILLGESLFDASSEIALINSMFRFAGSAAMEANFGNDSDRFLRRYSNGEGVRLLVIIILL